MDQSSEVIEAGVTMTPTFHRPEQAIQTAKSMLTDAEQCDILTPTSECAPNEDNSDILISLAKRQAIIEIFYADTAPRATISDSSPVPSE